MRKETAGVPPLKHEGQRSNDTVDKANTLNHQSQSVFTEDNKTEMPHMGNKNFNTMNDTNITINGVEKLLKELNPKKASGSDQLTPRILKELHHELPTTDTFNKSTFLGKTPTDWKHAFVCAIYKKVPHHEPANYSSVSLACILCKLMEHIVVSNVMKHLKTNKILSEFQHCFRSKRSYETQLLGLIHDITCTMDMKTQTDRIVLDFAKAFD